VRDIAPAGLDHFDARQSPLERHTVPAVGKQNKFAPAFQNPRPDRSSLAMIGGQTNHAKRRPELLAGTTGGAGGVVPAAVIHDNQFAIELSGRKKSRRRLDIAAILWLSSRRDND
jgi:hypothetical protein